MSEDANDSIHSNPEFIVWHGVLMQMLQGGKTIGDALAAAKQAVTSLKEDVNLGG